MEWVDTTPVVDRYDYGSYYNVIVNALVNRGYARSKNIFGAPYDFRKGPSETQQNCLIDKCLHLLWILAFFPDENGAWFNALKPLVEMVYEQNSQTGVVFVAHSLGGKMLLEFLQRQSTEWKDKYVNEIITLSVPWGGSVQALQAISVGYDFGSSIIQNAKMKEVQETCPSVVWLGPSEYFWKSDEILAQTAAKNYTVSDIDEFYRFVFDPRISLFSEPV